MKFVLFSFLSLLLTLTGCSDNIEEQEAELAEVERVEPVETLYNQAMDALEKENWKEAKKQFEEVERQHPYSVWAKKSQMLGAFANYKNQDYAEAVAILERFAQLYPGDEQIPYAYYLIALSYYEQISDVGRDQSMTKDALLALNEVMRRFPKSSYARDAALKKDLTIDHLAGKEMEIGRYYLSRKEYLAALKRFRKVVEDYQGTTHTPEALHRMVELYLQLGITDEARNYAAVLGHNYPGSEWYKDSYKLLAPAGISVPENPLITEPSTLPAVIPEIEMEEPAEENEGWLNGWF